MDISQYTLSGAHILDSAPLKSRRAQCAQAPDTAPVQPVAPTQQVGQSVSESGGLFETVLDTVNPLQHIPGVSTAYQAATGDTAGPVASMAGGFLFGGPVGLAAGASNSFLELITGKSLMGHAMALFSGEEDTPDAQPDAVQMAQNAPTDPVLAQLTTPGLSVQHYQKFAEAAETNRTGIGADTTDVALASDVWTQRALKDATGLYQSNQNLGSTETGRSTTRDQRLV